MMKQYEHPGQFELEGGQALTGLTIAYHTYGRLNKTGDNVIWVCHALTASSDVQGWWPGMVGAGCAFDTDKYFVVCANILGSCYGSAGPLSVNPKTGESFYQQFPQVTVRDMVIAFSLLRKHLSVSKIHLLAGGSMGGYQALEWCLMESGLIDHLFLIATSARESAWGIAIHSAQRLAIESDSSWGEPSKNAGQKGLKTARAIGMLTYRSYQTYVATQTDTDVDKLDHYKASSYIEHQGKKLVDRFNAYSYWTLTKSMDSHNIARGRAGSIEEVLKGIQQHTLIMGIKTDMLCPLPEQEMIANHIPLAELKVIDSIYAHDGFLIETTQITKHLKDWFEKIPVKNDSHQTASNEDKYGYN